MITHCVYDSKVNVGSNRNGEESEEEFDVSRKRVKMRDLHSLLQSQDVATYESTTSKIEDNEEEMDIIETQGSQIVDKNAGVYADARLLEGVPKTSSMHYGSKPLDLNSDLCTDENSGCTDAVVCLGDSSKQELYGKRKAVDGLYRSSLEITSSPNHDFFTNKSHKNLETRDMLSCGRTTVSFQEKDALKKWREMKENGFMSPSYGGIPPRAVGKQRGRKNKNELLKQKVEQAKKEQADRFAKIAAPTGLLNGLNPGIINHVRNSKQVHSIIQALVRSEKEGNLIQSSEMKAASRELPENDSGLENVSNISYGFGSLSSSPASVQLFENRSLQSGSSLFSSEDKCGQVESTIEGGRSSVHASLASLSNNCSDDNDKLALKLASSYMASENTSCLSNDESTSVDTLSVKAATVASQWLQLLLQDITGRLAALRRSKKRVCAVITTELPFLLSKEFESNQENTPSITKDPANSYSMKELHEAHWNKLFNQMETSLSEEEKQLESWLSEVNQMLQLCDQGMQRVQFNMAFEMRRLGAFNDDLRSKIIDPKKELSVRAAAASIHSTGNYVSSREKLSCC